MLNNNNSTGVIQIGQNREEGTETPGVRGIPLLNDWALPCSEQDGCKEASQEGRAELGVGEK